MTPQIHKENIRKNTERFLNKRIPQIELMLGYHFKDKSLLRQAFYHSRIPICDEYLDNDQLEFIGDRVLSVVIINLYTRLSLKEIDGYLWLPEVQSLSNYHQKHISNDYWKKIIWKEKNLIIRESLVLNPNDPNRKNKNSKIWADLFEAIFGALALDSNYDFKMMEKAFINLKFRTTGSFLKLCESELKMKEFSREKLLNF